MYHGLRRTHYFTFAIVGSLNGPFEPTFTLAETTVVVAFRCMHLSIDVCNICKHTVSFDYGSPIQQECFVRWRESQIYIRNTDSRNWSLEINTKGFITTIQYNSLKMRDKTVACICNLKLGHYRHRRLLCASWHCWNASHSRLHGEICPSCFFMHLVTSS